MIARIRWIAKIERIGKIGRIGQTGRVDWTDRDWTDWTDLNGLDRSLNRTSWMDCKDRAGLNESEESVGLDKLEE
uniref:Uncharacterized protein n=1 Tax=Acrobeloides nanus TaxID=290746 RepID=A0A914EIT2_9BILA